MRIISLISLCLIAASFAATSGAQDLIQSQPPLWSAKPDAAAFEKIENDRLAAAQRAIDKIVAAKGPRTIDNTLANYDEALKQLECCLLFLVADGGRAS